MNHLDRVLDRRVPPNFKHLGLFAFTAPEKAFSVEKRLILPTWHWTHNQGYQGSCVGHGTSMMMSFLNLKRYNTIWLWNEAKKVDGFDDTNPGDDNGTTVSASCDVLRTEGHQPVKSMRLVDGTPTPYLPQAVSKTEGILENRWARTVDDMRAAIARGIPLSIGINWYENFDNPINESTTSITKYFIGKGSLGAVRGGHCVCVYGASDRYQAFRIKNSWGRDYPLVWLPYSTMSRLLSEDGEASLVTDLPLVV